MAAGLAFLAGIAALLLTALGTGGSILGSGGAAAAALPAAAATLVAQGNLVAGSARELADVIQQVLQMVSGGGGSSNPPSGSGGNGGSSSSTQQQQQQLNDLADRIGEDFKNNPLRQQYEAEVNNLAQRAEMLKQEMGTSPEALERIAKQLSNERRQLGVKYKDMTPEPLRDYIYEVNRARYEDPLGANWEYLMNKYGGDFEKIIEATSRPNADVIPILQSYATVARADKM